MPSRSCGLGVHRPSTIATALCSSRPERSASCLASIPFSAHNCSTVLTASALVIHLCPAFEYRTVPRASDRVSPPATGLRTSTGHPCHTDGGTLAFPSSTNWSRSSRPEESPSMNDQNSDAISRVRQACDDGRPTGPPVTCSGPRHYPSLRLFGSRKRKTLAPVILTSCPGRPHCHFGNQRDWRSVVFVIS